MKWKFIFIAFIFCGCFRNQEKKDLSHLDSKESLENSFLGIYQAILAPINGLISGHSYGSLNLTKDDKDFIAHVRLSKGPASAFHIQGIHIGRRCPDERDDTNQDGYIDAEEGAQVYKEVLIPLDDDLSSQHMGLGTFPVSDEFGNYLWTRITSFEKMLEDLRDEDINVNDDYVKTDKNDEFQLSGFVVIIKGINELTPLPLTVKGTNRSSPQQSIPIACGVIRKILVSPGVSDKDETQIPVPEGETIGGTGGQDDGADFPSSNAGTTGGNYGDDDEN